MKFITLVERYSDRDTFMAQCPEPALLFEPIGEERLASIHTPSDPTPTYQKTWSDTPLSLVAATAQEFIHPETEVRWLKKTERNPFLGLITVGRAKNNDIILADPTISKLHAIFHRRLDTWRIEDRGSTNGTYLNSVRIPSNETYRTTDGVRINMGSVVVARFFEPETLASFCELVRDHGMQAPTLGLERSCREALLAGGSVRSA